MNPYPKITQVLCLIICGSVSATVRADASFDPASVQVARYSVMPATATPAQADLLAVVVNIKFPQQIATVGEALDFLLRRSGYRLAETDSPAMTILQRLPLPAVHRHIGPLTLKNALLTLAGPAYRLAIDPLHRTLNFTVAPPLSSGLIHRTETPPQLSQTGKAHLAPNLARE